MNVRSASLFPVSCLVIGLWAAQPLPAAAKTQVTASTIQEADAQTVADLVATFEQAEQAMQARDLDGIMALYAEDYYYHGLKKADIRKVWAQLFDNYTDLQSFHTFSVIRTVGASSKLTAEMTCTGGFEGMRFHRGARRRHGSTESPKTGRRRVTGEGWRFRVARARFGSEWTD